MPSAQSMTHSVDSTNLADLLERILDKGVVVAGDISIKLVEVELLTIQLRLVICSVDKARELGLDWWNHNGRQDRLAPAQNATLARWMSDWVGSSRRSARSSRRPFESGVRLMSKEDRRRQGRRDRCCGLRKDRARPFRPVQCSCPISTSCRAAAGTRRTGR